MKSKKKELVEVAVWLNPEDLEYLLVQFDEGYLVHKKLHKKLQEALKSIIDEPNP